MSSPSRIARLPRWRAAQALVGVVAAAACVASCSNTPKPNGISGTSLPPTVKLRQGGVATVAVPYLPTNFNPSTPAGANEVTQMVMEQVWPQGVIVDPAFNAVTSTDFAPAELISLAPQTIAYKIDPAAVWSDGTPITAQDFIYNWHQQVANAGALPFSAVVAGYRDITSITGSEKGRLVTVVFRRPYADWEGLFADLVPAHIGERIGWAGFDSTHVSDLLSAGPFQVASVVPGQELVLRRNRRWWGTAARLEEIVFRVVRGEAAVWSALSTGSVSVGMVETAAGVATHAAGLGLTASTTLSPALWQLCFNLGDGSVSDPRLRRAIAVTLDRTLLVSHTAGLLDPGIPTAENRLFMGSAPGAALTPSPYSGSDHVRAGRLFRQLGYRLNASGQLVKDGVPLVLKFTVPSGVRVAGMVEAVLQTQLQRAGIGAVFSSVPLSSLVDSVLPGGTFQIALVPYWLPDYQSWTRPVYGRRAPGGSGGSTAPFGSPSVPIGAVPFVTSNVAGLVDGAIGTLYSQASAQLDLPTAHGLYNEINTLLWDDLPTIPLFQQPVTLVTAHNLVNVSESPSWAGVMWNAEDWAIAANLPKPTTTTSSTTSNAAVAS